MTTLPADRVQFRSPWVDSVPKGWDQVKLGHIARIYAGGTPDKKNDSFWSGGTIPWVNSGAVNQVLITAASEYITETGYANSSARLVPKGALVMALAGQGRTKGMVAQMGIEATCNQSMAAIVIEEDEPRYFLHWLTANYRNIRGIASDDLRDGLNLQHLSNIPCPRPPLAEQIAIASYLDTETARIDALLEEKRKLADLLAELRVGAVLERTSGLHLQGERRPTGSQFMPAIPVTWKFVPIGRYARITNGSTPLKDNEAFWNGGTYPWLNSAVVNQDDVTEGSELVTEQALRLCHLPIVPPGSVLVALTGQGKTRGQATVLRIEATINQHLAAVVPEPQVLDGEFLFWTLTGLYQALRMVSDGQGGTKGALTCDELARFPIPLPTLAEQKQIAADLYTETRRIDDLIEHVKNEQELLAEYRACTIAEAVLGRIDVTDHIKN